VIVNMIEKYKIEFIIGISILLLIISFNINYPDFSSSIPNKTDGMQNGIALLFIYIVVYGGIAFTMLIHFILSWIVIFTLYKIFTYMHKKYKQE